MPQTLVHEGHPPFRLAGVETLLCPQQHEEILETGLVESTTAGIQNGLGLLVLPSHNLMLDPMVDCLGVASLYLKHLGNVLAVLLEQVELGTDNSLVQQKL